jgi:vacuolar-type H+-ATPase subunit F/Vma7
MTAMPLRHDIHEGAAEAGDIYRWMTNATAVINELQAAYVAQQAILVNGLVSHGTILISGTAEKFKTTTPTCIRISGVPYVKPATDALVFSAAHIVTALKYGVILIQQNAAGTISSKVPSSTQAYDSAPLALAALPTADSGNVALGYITISAGAANWDANTDDMTDASDLTAATFNNATPLTAAAGGNALLAHGTLTIDAAAEKYKTTTASVVRINGITYQKAATTAQTFTTTHTITASKFGTILLQQDALGAISSKVASATQAYDTAPLALAALPTADAGKVAVGYIAIANNTGDWVANTDDLTNGSDVTTAAFNDYTPVTPYLVPMATPAETTALTLLKG